jgi:hypothetical protein
MGILKELKAMILNIIYEIKKMIGLDLLTFKGWVFASAGGITLGVMTSFVESYIWSPSGAYFTFIFLLVADFVAAIFIAFRNKKFETRKATRILWKLVGFTALFAISFNLAKHDSWLSFLPEAVYFPAVIITLLSFIKHLSVLGIVPKKIATMMINNIDLYKDKLNVLPKETTPDTDNDKERSSN